MRKLNRQEQERLKLLTQNQVAVTLLEPTATGLHKSIMDATGIVRNYLKEFEVHDYSLQGRGPENKVKIKAKLYQESAVTNSITSLYRPKTKKGDPRLWFSGLKKYTEANDILAILHFDDMLHVLNLTRLPIEILLKKIELNPVKELIATINRIENRVAQELLAKLRTLAASGPIRSVVNADTSVGRTLETALGIAINSSKQPDYKGIELKSYRSNRKAKRKNLFAQVPNWNLSKFKSSAEILNAFGYERGEDFKLYCTASAITRNSQGLMLRLDNELKQLFENSDKTEIGDFVIWTMDKLHKRLAAKHRETFWVSAESTFKENDEYFQYQMVEHTRSPILSQFDILIEQGNITLDHLIKRDRKGKVVEKGPLFKIDSTGIDLLFPPSVKYDLMKA